MLLLLVSRANIHQHQYVILIHVTNPRIRIPLVTNIITVSHAVLMFNREIKRMSSTFPLKEFPVSNKNPLSNSTMQICHWYKSSASRLQFTISTSVSTNINFNIWSFKWSFTFPKKYMCTYLFCLKYKPISLKLLTFNSY